MHIEIFHAQKPCLHLAIDMTLLKNGVPQGVKNSHGDFFFYLYITIDMIVFKNAVHQSVEIYRMQIFRCNGIFQ